MPDWNRTTREVPFEGLMPEMVSAINAHIELYNLGSVLVDTLMCIQTDSEKAEKGLFGRQEKVSQAAIVTPRWLIWVVKSAGTPTAVAPSFTLRPFNTTVPAPVTAFFPILTGAISIVPTPIKEPSPTMVLFLFLPS